MNKREIRILVVEDAPTDAELCLRELRRAGLLFTARCVEHESDFQSALAEWAPDLILSDFTMPDFDGLAALDLARAVSDIPFIFVSGTIGEDRAVEAMRRGATDYVLKDRLGRLAPVVRRALQEAEERGARRKAEEQSRLHAQQLRRVNRILAVLSDINAAIVRIHDRQQLFEEGCRIAVENGGFGMAWIGRYDGARREIVPVAAARAGAGENPGAPGDELIARGRVTGNRDTIARVIEQGRPVFCNDLAREPVACGEQGAEAIRRGYRSVISLPLKVEGAIVGTMSLFATEPGFFDAEEIKLLTELAEDISYALDHIGKEEKLSYLAYYDVLTGLPNRTLFQDRLEQRVSAARRDRRAFAVMMLDIGRFRHINDTLGRQAGDELLRMVSARLAAALEETDIIARVGVDYFTVAARDVVGAAEVVHLLEQILAGVAGHPYAVGESELRIAMRAGVALYPSDGNEGESLLRNAEAALNDAKRTGNQYQFYAPQMNARVAEYLKLENELRRAILAGEFVLHYQPRVELTGGRVSGFEALIRWVHPARGIVPPGEFIGVLEGTGMILEVGLWALRRAAQDHAAWRAAGLNPPRIAVNVSAVQLRRKQFVEEVRAALAASAGFEHIDIEITESMMMQDIEGNIGKLKELQAMGVRVAMDDFGTGYCSLSYLARLPINSLKVDRAFILPITHGAQQLAIVSTIVSLAHAHNLKVCAEGVEAQEQANLLAVLRCDEVQGDLFGGPEPFDQAARRLGSR